MNDTDKELNDKALKRYVYLHVDPSDLFRPDEKEQSGITIHVKMDDAGIAVDVWGGEDEVVASTWKLYSEFGVEVKEIEDEE